MMALRTRAAFTSTSAPFLRGSFRLTTCPSALSIKLCTKREAYHRVILCNSIEEEAHESVISSDDIVERRVPLVVQETEFRDERYGKCFACGSPVVIPGLSHVFCEKCGWVKRPAEVDTTVLTGHHD